MCVVGSSPTCGSVSRKKKLAELGIKSYNEEGLIPAIAAMLDEATRPTKVTAKNVDGAKLLIRMLQEHCSQYFVFYNPTYSKLQLLQSEIEGLTTAGQMLSLVYYYNEEKDFSWATSKMGVAYLIKNVSTDLARALDYTPEEGPQIR